MELSSKRNKINNNNNTNNDSTIGMEQSFSTKVYIYTNFALKEK